MFRPILLVALASIGFGVARVWPELGRQHDRYASWSDRQVAFAGALHEHLATEPFDVFRRAVRPELRYYLDVPGTKRAPGFIYKTFATYYLLPAVPVASRLHADVVFSYRGGRAKVTWTGQ